MKRIRFIIIFVLLEIFFVVQSANAQSVQRGKWVVKNNCSLAATSEKTLNHALDLLFKAKDKEGFLRLVKTGDAGFLVKGTTINIDEIYSCGAVKIRQKGYDGVLFSINFMLEHDGI